MSDDIERAILERQSGPIKAELLGDMAKLAMWDELVEALHTELDGDTSRADRQAHYELIERARALQK